MKKSAEWQSRQTMLNNDFEIFHYKDCNPGGVKLHCHDFYELYYFVSGSVTYTIESKEYKLKKGDMLIILPNEYHKLSVEGGLSYERIVMWFTPSFLRKVSTEQTNFEEKFKSIKNNINFTYLSSNNNEEIKDFLLKIYELSSSKMFGDDILVYNYIKNALVKILLHKPEKHKPSVENLVVSKLVDYINSNLHKSLTITELSELLYLSPSRIAHIFKDQIGSSIHQYILKKKLFFAKDMIEAGEQITEVFVKCGMKDYSSFFRAYKNEFGISPKKYYKLISQINNKN